MKNNLKMHILLALFAPLGFIQCQKNDLLELPEVEAQEFWYPTPQDRSYPAFEVVIREAVCLQGGMRLEAVVRHRNSNGNDLYSYDFHWFANGTAQVPGAVLPCFQGRDVKVRVVRKPDGAVVEKRFSLENGAVEAVLFELQ